MTPLSKEEIQAIKAIPVAEYLEIPVLYHKELTSLLSIVVPKLLAIAEDHSKLYGQIQNLNQPIRVTSEELVQMEKDIISNLEAEIVCLKNFYDQKVQEWVEIRAPEPKSEPKPEPKLGFWRKLYRKLLCR